MSLGRTVTVKLRLGAVLVGAAVAATACGSGGGGSSHPSSRPPATSRTGTVTPSSTGSASRVASPPGSARPQQAQSCVDRVLNGMSPAQRVGQLIMSAVSASGATTSELDTLRRDRIGSVILMGHTDGGTAAVRSVTDRVQSLAQTASGARVGMLVSADQEGGQIQVLNGPGFSVMPSGVAQGRLPTAQLQQRAAQWGRQLRSAGVTMDLAPVVDIVPPDLVTVNQPIGKLQREYGTDQATVARQSSAFVRGIQQSGVFATLKHFPSLGQVRGNTDFSADVTDDTTVRNGTFLVPYRSGIDAGARFVMASLATYTRIDPQHQSVFSGTLLNGVLRGTLGFKGVVISDDMGKAVAVRSVPAGQRAVRFLSSGGDLVLTVLPSTVHAMASAVLAKRSSDAAFRSRIDASVRRVLDAKADAGLLGCSR